MIKYITAKRYGATDTILKVDTEDPVVVRGKSPRRVIAEWLNSTKVRVISIYECVHSSIPKELICWYENEDIHGGSGLHSNTENNRNSNL